MDELQYRASLADLSLIPMTVRHLGTDRSRAVLQKMYSFLQGRVDIRVGTAARTILTRNGAVSGIETKEGQRFECRYIIIAPGREGADWLVHEAEQIAPSRDLLPHTVSNLPWRLRIWFAQGDFKTPTQFIRAYEPASGTGQGGPLVALLRHDRPAQY
jgi:hypothetical protein